MCVCVSTVRVGPSVRTWVGLLGDGGQAGQGKAAGLASGVHLCLCVCGGGRSRTHARRTHTHTRTHAHAHTHTRTPPQHTHTHTHVPAVRRAAAGRGSPPPSAQAGARCRCSPRTACECGGGGKGGGPLISLRVAAVVAGTIAHSCSISVDLDCRLTDSSIQAHNTTAVCVHECAHCTQSLCPSCCCWCPSLSSPCCSLSLSWIPSHSRTHALAHAVVMCRCH